VDNKITKHRLFASTLVWCLAALYAALLLNFSPALEEQVDWISVWAEGAMALMPAFGLAVITQLEHKKVHRLLFLGFTLLVIALLTDTLDEFVDVPSIMTHVCEGACQVIGFLILILGLREWTQYNQQINDQLSHQASTDPLTGISNRRVFMAELDAEIKTLKRFPKDLSVILFDLDYFKRINDTYGHALGDEVLMEVWNLISRQIRDIDMFARFGGEEFVIAARQTNPAQAMKLAEKILGLLHQVHVGDINGIKASFGISHYHDGDSTQTLLKRADDALYRSKELGRDTISQEAS
jgi:diguanylate cyclase (GGDEF)-like protein